MEDRDAERQHVHLEFRSVPQSSSLDTFLKRGDRCKAMSKEDLPLTLVIFLILITLTVMGIPAAKKLGDKLTDSIKVRAEQSARL